jgi:acyl-CoA synthetase (AMP-forming)/AMP-acid ligase II
MIMTQSGTTVTDFLLEGKEKTRVALRLLDRDHNYGELQSASADVAKYLVQAGGQKGDRAILVSENSLFWVATYLGILKAGLVCVPLPTSLSPEDLDYILQITEARFAFLQQVFATRNASRFRRESLVTDGGARLANIPAALTFANLRSQVSHTDPALPAVDPDDLAALMFTSGSTGRPRGVMVSHANIMANTESIIQYLSLTEKDRMMDVLPFHYCFGTSLLHTHLRVGGGLVIDSRFMYPEAVLQRMLDTKCTGFAGVPSHFQILLRNSSLRTKRFPYLRHVQQAGGHLAPNFIRELRQALPGTQVFIMYGQTEATARLSYLPPEFLDTKLGSIGKGIPGMKLRVLNASGDEVSPGEVGEIVAEGESVTLGYWRAPEESAASFRDGRLYTGDMATVDEDGFIFVVDRAKDFLKCGGERVSCRHLEDRLLEFEDLLEAAVIGVPDDRLGEAVKAFVVARKPDCAGLEERLRLFCKERMPFQFVPREIVVVPALPKNSGGKVLKQILKTL